jgi:hypothetical protein
MAIRHVVQQGDCIASIAFEHGFFPDTIWMHHENDELRKARLDPNVLLPGDEVFVPDKRVDVVKRATDARHVFRRRGVPEVLRIQLLRHGKPRKHTSYSLEIDGVVEQGMTDDDGVVGASIPPAARRGVLTLTDTGESFDLDLGGLDPVTELTGVQGRLRNLGLYRGPIDGVLGAQTERALRRFQELEPDLEPSGALDDATRDALERRARGGSDAV